MLEYIQYFEERHIVTVAMAMHNIFYQSTSSQHT